MKLISPLLITGMHRSGTTLLVKILEKNGIFFGAYQDHNQESIFFQRLNRWLVSFNNSYWDNPKSFDTLDNKNLDFLISKCNKSIQNKILILYYFGFKNIFLNNSFSSYDLPWGWKDPLNTFTLDIWSKIFPCISVINIVRNPIDVSCSLINRQSKMKSHDLKNLKKYFNSLIPILSINKGAVFRSFEINTIDDCLILYKKYQDKIKLNNLKNIKQINIKYEDLVNNTEDELIKIYSFCGIDNFNLKQDSKLIDKNIVNKYNNLDISFDSKLLDLISYDK